MQLIKRRTPVGARFRRALAKTPLSLVLTGLLATAPAIAVDGQGPSVASATEYGRNVDRRLNQVIFSSVPGPSASQVQALDAFRAQRPDVLATYDNFGATRSLLNPTGNLTQAPRVRGQDAAVTASSFVQDNVGLLGLSPADLTDMVLTDRVPSISGVTHLYYSQAHNGLQVYGAQLQVHVTGNGAIALVNNSFVPRLADAVSTTLPQVTAEQAVQSAASFLGISLLTAPRVLQRIASADQATHLEQSQLSPETIVAKLVLLPMRPGVVVPAWNFQFQTDDVWPDITVNAISGELVTSFDWISDATFRVYEQPVESPQHTSPTPPADARTLAVNPEDPTASRNGWFDANTTLMDGNNVHACADRDGNNACDNPQPQCSGSLVCDFSLNLSANPSNSVPAAIANLFYWNNIIHDVQYQYGFDEAGGNFQENNFGQGGAGSDSVNAQAQDNANGGSNCNANFGTPADGGNPRMQMFLCNNSNPSRDGDFDNGVIVHEYGHGISTRQVGGPSTNCLNNRQQAGEGWSDYHALVYTAVASDRGTDARGVGSYLFGLATDGTIRPQRYSTNPAVNNYTYESINGLAVPHGVGSVWSQVAWEVYWALVDEYGFEGNLQDFDLNNPNEAGNKRALYYINEGLKNTNCRPTFVDNRNGVIAAATNSFGGADVCRLWDVFANFGLGTNAVSGGANSTTPTNGFAVPAECDNPPPPPPPPPPTGSCLFSADFNGGAQGFVFVDDPQDPAFTAGTAAGGALNVAVGGINNTTVTNMLGSWDRGCSLTGSRDVTITLSASLTQSADYEADEVSELRLTVNGNTNVLASLTGNGNGGADQTTGLQTFTANVTLPSGNSTISLGCFNNKKTFANEDTDCAFDSIAVAAAGGPPPGQCSVEQNFDSNATGWSNAAGSTCTTGAFIRGTPTEVINGGVTTQVGGDHTSGTGSALFTATNTAAGTDDVDGGNCILLSPVFNVSDASTLSAWYFHGQRDAGDDAAGDFFRLEVSTNGGSSFTPLVTIGDATSNAVWTEATGQIPAGAQVQLRMQASDGTAGGDLIEAGIDDVSICSN